MLSVAKWGALVGVAIYLVAQILLLVTNTAFPGAVDVNNPGAVSLGCLSLLLLLFAFSTSGFYSGRETGVAGLGAVAGMLTFVVYDALTAIYSVGGHVAQTTTRGGALGAAVVAVIAFLLYVGLAALIGWLGGRPGAARTKRGRTALAGDANGMVADTATETPTKSEPGAR